MEKQEIKENISKILEEFLRQEQGNRITTFNMQGLTAAVMNIIENGIKVINKKE